MSSYGYQPRRPRRRPLRWHERPRVKRFLRIVIVLLTLLLIGLGGFCWWAYRAIQRVPEFYETVRAASREQLRAASDQFEQRVAEFQKELEKEGAWEAVFTEEQINGWLTVDAPQQFGNQIPPEIETPVVDLEPDTVWVAVRLKTKSFDTVLNLAAELTVDPQKNEIEVHVLEAYAGDLPIPLGTVKKRLRQYTSQLAVDLRWTGEDDELIARIGIPRFVDKWHRERILERIVVNAGYCVLSGRTARPSSKRP